MHGSQAVCVAVTLALSAVALKAAETDDGDVVPASTHTMSKSMSWTGGPAKLTLTREVEVYKGTAGSSDAGASKFLFLHSPLWALVPADDGAAYVRRSSSPGSTGERWWVRFMVSSKTVREHLEGELRNHPNVKTLPGVRLDHVSVSPYRVRGGLFRCYHALAPEKPLASGQLTGNNPFGDVRIAQLDLPQPEAFRAALKDGDARCSITYQTLSRQVSMASTVLSYQERVTELVQREETAQRDRQNVGFATDRDRLKSQMAVDVNMFTVTNSPQALALLPRLEGLAAQLFKTSTFEFARSDPRKELVESYLKAATKTMTDTRSESDKSTAKDSLELDVNIGGETFKMSPKMRQEFERTHEVTLTKGTTLNSVVPGRITRYQLKDNWREVLAQGVSQLVVSKAMADTGTTVEVDLALTAATAEKSLGAGTVAGADSVLLPGAAVCHFGQMPLPRGWVLLDGTQKWPADPWVPAHLRGKPLPDMRGATAVGAAAAVEVGANKLDTAFKLPAWEIAPHSVAFSLSTTPGPLTTWWQRHHSAYSWGPFDLNTTPANPQFRPRTLDESPYYPLARPDIFVNAPSGTTVVATPHAWTRVGVLNPSGPGPNLSSVPPVPWTDSNRMPYAKCQWILKL